MGVARGLVVFLGLLGACAKSPGTSVVEQGTELRLPLDLSTELPVDPGVTMGQLPNGLTWYVEENGLPAGRAELRLVVKAGSILEEDDQRGLAHFVEHMAFNGTEHFEGNELVLWLESIGARFGAHLNAYTSFDETVYKLQIPSDDPAYIEDSFLVLRDWAQGVTFDPVECEKERGVVLEEWRLDQGVGARVSDFTLPLMFGDSLYLDRRPIGSGDHLAQFDCDAAVRFYETWYRPELMAVMVVGDVDTKQVERLVQEYLGDLENPKPARKRTYHRIPDHDEVLVGVLADEEVSQSVLSVMDKVDNVQSNTHEAYRELEVHNMATYLMNERLAVRGQDADVAYQFAGIGLSPLGHERAAQSLQVLAKEGREVDALRDALIEVERMKRYGFSEIEVERARKEMFAAIDAWIEEKETTDSAEHIEELLRVYLTGEPMPGIEYEDAMVQAYVPDISADEINAHVRDEWLTGKSRSVMAIMPDKPGLAVPTDAQLLAVIDEVGAMQIEPPKAEAEAVPLMSTLPTPGSVVAETYDEALDLHTWTLSNGARVLVKSTDFRSDVVLFSAFAPGGLSLIDDQDYIAGVTSGSIMLESGVAEHDAITLSRLMAGKRVHVAPYIGEYFEGVTGGSSRGDLETAMQLLVLGLTEPRFEQSAFDREKERRLEGLRNEVNLPDYKAEQLWSETLWGDDIRANPWVVEDLQQMSLEGSERIYNQRFSNLSDMTFLFVGNVTPEELRPLAERYLASLPAEGKADTWVDRGRRPIDQARVIRADRGSTPRFRVKTAFYGPFDATPENRMELMALGEVLKTGMGEKLREELGGTYGVSVTTNAASIPRGAYQIQISFEGDPSREKELIEAMWEVIEQVKSEKVGSSYMATLTTQQLRKRESESKDNGFWLAELTSYLRRGENPHDMLEYERRLLKVDAERIRKTANELLDEDRYLMMVVSPSEDEG